MNETLLQTTLLGHAVTVTGWKLIGYAGTLMFTGRWFVQMAASHARQKSHVPQTFWYMSLAGSFLLLAYFIWGNNDSVGIISNLFPCLVAVYNLHLVAREGRVTAPAPAAAGAVRDDVRGGPIVASRRSASRIGSLGNLRHSKSEQPAARVRSLPGRNDVIGRGDRI